MSPSDLWAAHAAVLPVLLPVFTAVAMLLVGDGPGRLSRLRVLALASTALGLLVALGLAAEAQTDVLRVYRLGNWPAPFGIVLVVDRLSALMLVLTQAVALPVLVYACTRWDARGRFFHPLFQFQLMGLSGAFVTGDLFNLFVFFEVLLIASYALLVHGQGAQRFKAGLHYVVLNLAASALFLIGVSLLYAVAGTLNLAELALRVGQVPAADAGLLRAAGLLLLLVFGFKAALMPVSMWLPATYAAASAPVAALFAIMTKVGVYAVLRVHGVVFGDQAGPAAEVAADWLLPLALATCVMGAAGALAARSFAQLVAWLNVASVGTVLAGLGLYSQLGWSAALYYMVQSTLVVAALFLLAELVSDQRGESGGLLQPGTPLQQPVLLGLLVLVAAVAAAGLPPLPGFLGKLMILQAAGETTAAVWIWSIVLGVGFAALLSLARAGSELFWHVLPDVLPAPTAQPARAVPVMATAGLLLVCAGLAAWASPAKRYVDAAAAQVLDLQGYARAVLGEDRLVPGATVRPYPGPAPTDASAPQKER